MTRARGAKRVALMLATQVPRPISLCASYATPGTDLPDGYGSDLAALCGTRTRRSKR